MIKEGDLVLVKYFKNKPELVGHIYPVTFVVMPYSKLLVIQTAEKSWTTISLEQVEHIYAV